MIFEHNNKWCVLHVQYLYHPIKQVQFQYQTFEPTIYSLITPNPSAYYLTTIYTRVKENPKLIYTKVKIRPHHLHNVHM